MSYFTSQLPSRGSAAPYAGLDRRSASADRLRRFPFVIAALVVVVLAAFVLFGAAAQEQMGPAVAPNPWQLETPVTERVPATPSRGAMGLPQ